MISISSWSISQVNDYSSSHTVKDILQYHCVHTEIVLYIKKKQVIETLTY